MSGLISERWTGELWPALASFPDPKILIQTCLIIFFTNKHRFACSLIYVDRYFVYGKIYPLLTIFRIALSSSFFWVLGEGDFSLLPRYTHRSLLRISPTLLPPLSPYYTSQVPNHYRLQSSRITKPPNGTVPFDSSNSEVM